MPRGDAAEGRVCQRLECRLLSGPEAGRGPGPSRSLVRAVWSQPRSPVGGTEVTVGLPASRPSKARDAGALLSETPDAHV